VGEGAKRRGEAEDAPGRGRRLLEKKGEGPPFFFLWVEKKHNRFFSFMIPEPTSPVVETEVGHRPPEGWVVATNSISPIWNYFWRSLEMWKKTRKYKSKCMRCLGGLL
jgi:hypothetical protein